MMLITAGPKSTTNILGKIKSTKGKIIFTVVFAANSSIFCMRCTRRLSENCPSDFAIGVGKRRQLLFNDDAYEHRGKEWLRLVAHELTHVSQIELAQGEGRGEQWLAEGLAEWVAFSVLERLELDTIEHRRLIARAGIRSHAALHAARLDLETLGSPRGFTVRHLREGSLPTYQLAFLMADYLITRDGLPKVVDYFRTFATRQNRFDNFRRAFGQTLAEFEQEILAHLKTVTR